MGQTATRTIAVLAALLGLLAALLLFAPARWLAQGLSRATRDQVQLVNARGTVWHGQADLLFTGGDGSRSRTALPGGLRWSLRPAWFDGPALRMALQAPCCTPEPLALHWRAGWQGGTAQVARFDSTWPAELLIGLGTPWNTLRLEGRLALRSDGLTLRRSDGQLQLQGGLQLDAIDMASRVSPLRPLGSYRTRVRAEGDNGTVRLELSTLRGELRLQGSGQWVGGQLRFTGDAQAAPGAEIALENLLNIVGRRQGARSVITIG